MDTTLDFSRWREKPLGLAYRRWVIVSYGLRQVTRTRFSKILIFAAWMGALFIGAVCFSFSQSVASGGWLESLAANLGARPLAIAKAVGGLVLLYPDVCIHTLYTWVFWLQSYVGLGLSLIAMTTIVPQLVTRDRASHALTIYLSRPLTSLDYLLGKLGIIVCVLGLVWTGPLICGWLISLLLSPDRDFFFYSLKPLGSALLFNGIGLVTLASIALGVSTLNKSSRNAVGMWVGLWLVGSAIAGFPGTPDWLRSASFSRDLSVVRQEVFRLDSALISAAQTLPIVDKNFSANLERLGRKQEPEGTRTALFGLACLAGLSSFAFFRRLRAE